MKRVALERLLTGFAARATKTGASLAAFSGQRVQKARVALGKAGAASKKTIDRLAREWNKMDSKRRVQFVAALLTALAAASAPIVRTRMKKK